jgi:hypothetical protein
MSIRIKLVAFAATLLLLTGAQSQAAYVGTLALVDIGSPTANSGNINTATSFTIGNLFSTVGTGVLAGEGGMAFGAVTFTTTGTGSLSFGNASFGSFTSTSVLEFNNSAPGSASFYFVGILTPGTGDPGTATAASFTVGFTQTPASTGQIGDSGTFSVPPAGAPIVPEPASFAMVAIGLGGIFAVGRFRRRAA